MMQNFGMLVQAEVPKVPGYTLIVKNTFLDMEAEVQDDSGSRRRSSSEPPPTLTCFSEFVTGEETPLGEGQSNSVEELVKKDMEDTSMQKSMAWQQVGWNAEQQVIGPGGPSLPQDPFSSIDSAALPEVLPHSAVEAVADPPHVATDTVTMQTLHAQGRCAPCLFYTRKKDGCRKGDDCEHCHICSKQEAKRRRNKNQCEARKLKKAQRLEEADEMDE